MFIEKIHSICEERLLSIFVINKDGIDTIYLVHFIDKYLGYIQIQFVSYYNKFSFVVCTNEHKTNEHNTREPILIHSCIKFNIIYGRDDFANISLV